MAYCRVSHEGRFIFATTLTERRIEELRAAGYTVEPFTFTIGRPRP